MTVRLAADAYLDGLAARNHRSANDARLRLKRLFLPTFGDRLVTDLTRTQSSDGATVWSHRPTTPSRGAAARIRLIAC